ncbi:mechanosensitive ion channel domain-containing protein [Neosynechococcus sphagnicola]|uniref:mechanosensitive ion channel domain-containing protein n=1 Tax=Neosynechococcus sphagnicola TaxID=1501145 RepID=UPI00138DFAA1|nr:mechanosensitive ion channel domain-containing protein [Neosynechococcus sphagnicola]
MVGLLKRSLKHHLLVSLGIDESNREVISTLTSYALGALGFIAVVEISGFQLASLTLVAGGLGVGIGFGLQDIAKNLLSGLTLLLERKLKVGDYIELDNLAGYIQEISMRSTVIRTLYGSDVVIPNSNLTSNRILNWSYSSYTGCIPIPIGVSFDSDPVLVTETLLSIAYSHPAALHDPPPKVLFTGFGDSALNFELWVWVSRVDQSVFIKSALNFAIEYNFRKRGIKIPFPQQELWLRNLEALAIQKFPGTPSVAEPAAPADLPLISEPSPAIYLRDLLRQVPYFQSYTELELQRLVGLGYRQMFAAAEIICKEGELSHAFYIILSGSVELRIVRVDKLVDTLRTNQFFGNISLTMKLPFVTTISTLENTVLFVIPEKNFEKLLREHPDFAEVVAQESVKSLEFITEQQQWLRGMGLMDTNNVNLNLLDWFRMQLNRLFNSD